jgi:hypothetical protein
MTEQEKIEKEKAWKKRLERLEKMKSFSTDDERIYHGIWYLLLFAKKELGADPEYRAYSILQSMGVIPYPNNDVMRYKKLVSDYYKRAYGEYIQPICDAKTIIHKFYDY